MVLKLKEILLCLILSAIVVGATACEQEGTMEKSGKAVDKAVEDAGYTLKDAKDKMEEAVEEAKK